MSRRPYVFTPARRRALHKAQLASAKKRRKFTKIDYRGGFKFTTRKQRTAFGGRVRYRTYATKKGQLYGWASSYQTGKNKAKFAELYVAPEQRGKGLSQQLINAQVRHKPKSIRKITITGIRSEGGQKSTRRLRFPKQAKVIPQKRLVLGTKLVSPLITREMDVWYQVHKRAVKRHG